MKETQSSSPDTDLASPQEVLVYLSAIMRGVIPLPDSDDPAEASRPSTPSTSERMKAAELLGKRYRLFSETPPSSQDALPVIIDDIAHRRQP